MNTEQLPRWMRNLWLKFAGRTALREARVGAETEYIYTLEEFEAEKVRAGFSSGHHGTYRTPDRTSYLYTKPCHRVETEQQVTESLAFLRFATAKGVLYPGTTWGVYRTAEDDFQLFANTPALVNHWDNKRAPDPSRQPLYGVAYGDFGEDSHLANWVRRLDPSYTSFTEGRRSLTRLLNTVEATHPDNWGWDGNGTLYPVDVEVLDIAGPDRQSLVHRWYVQQQYDAAGGRP